MLLLYWLRTFKSTSTLALLIFVTEFQQSLSKPQKFSDELVNDLTRVKRVNYETMRSVNDGFTVTKEDKDYFEARINSSQVSTAETIEPKVDLRIVQGRSANLGTN